MVNDAKAHAEDDRKRRDLVEERNRLDSLLYTTEKTIGELGDKVTAELKGAVNTAIEEAKKALESNEQEAMKAAYVGLEKASHKVSEEAYKRAAEQQGAAANGAADHNGTAASADKEDVVDADYEEVRDSK